MGVRTFEEGPGELVPRRGPGLAPAALLALVVLLLLLANGRPIGVGDGRGLAGLLTGPFVATAGFVVDVDDLARALAGKLAASVFAARATTSPSSRSPAMMSAVAKFAT